MKAYYWSKFHIPVSELELVPEFSEERVLNALEKGIKDPDSRMSLSNMKISEITASRKYLMCVCDHNSCKKDG